MTNSEMTARPSLPRPCAACDYLPKELVGDCLNAGCYVEQALEMRRENIALLRAAAEDPATPGDGVDELDAKMIETMARTPPPGEAPAQPDPSLPLANLLLWYKAECERQHDENAALRQERDALQAQVQAVKLLVLKWRGREYQRHFGPTLPNFAEVLAARIGMAPALKRTP